MALCTLDEVKSFLSIDGVADLQEELLESLIDNISKVFEVQCDRVFDSTEHTEYFNGEGRSWVRLRYYPVTSVSGVWDNTEWSWDDDALIDSSDYRVAKDDKFIILKNLTFYNGVQNVKVIYTAGYSTIPFDLKLACIDEVARLYKSRTQRHLTNYSNTEGENNVYDLMAFSDMTKKTLQRYLNK